MEQKKQRGGKRPGAGRPASNVNRQAITRNVTPEEKQAVDELLKKIREEKKMLKTIVINEYAELTNDHVGSRYGIPVFHTVLDGRGYGPSEKTYADKFNAAFGLKTAADQIIRFAQNNPALSTEDIDFIKLFLGQWPEGPQL